MTFGSLFAGIGGFDLGLTRAGWECRWHVEQNPECREVLAARFPGVPALEDVRTAGPHNLEPVDLICGGFPCQDLSVAGKRAGLAGARSGLFYDMARIVHGLRPTWLLWENVPGLLSSNSGRDFAAVLVELERIGYSGGWTTLDARYFGLAQRRRRVFGVFTSQRAGARRAAQVLALAARLQGNPPPRREAREGAAGPPAPGARGGGAAPGAPSLADPLSTSEGRTYTHEGSTFRLRNVVPDGGDWPADVAPTLNTAFGTKQGLEDQHAMSGAGLFVPTNAAAVLTDGGGRLDPETSTFVLSSGQANAQLSANATGALAASSDQPIVFDPTQITHPENRSNPQPGDPSPSLSMSGRPPAVAETPRVGGRDQGAGDGPDNTPLVASTVRSNAHNNSDPAAEAAMHVPGPAGVRRLTPTECERLQGFPDGWTEGHADTHRYRMLGNAVAVPCAEWIGRRLAVDLDNPEVTEC